MKTLIVYKIEDLAIRALADIIAAIIILGYPVFFILKHTYAHGFNSTYRLIRRTLRDVRERINDSSLIEEERWTNTPPKSPYYRKLWEESRAYSAKEEADVNARMSKPGAIERIEFRDDVQELLCNMFRWSLMSYYLTELVRLIVIGV